MDCTPGTGHLARTPGIVNFPRDTLRGKMRGRNHSRELKLEVVRQVESGERRPAQVCREHNLAESVLFS